jgi:hypothetical protein
MSESQNLLSGKRKYLYGLILLSFISVLCVSFSLTGSDDLISPGGKFYSAGSDMKYYYSLARVYPGYFR